MWRSKKFIIVAVIAAVVLVASIGGVALAQTGSGDNSQHKTLTDRVVAILVAKGVNITSAQLDEAFNQARSEERDEFLQNLVTESKITQAQADQYKAWLNSRPDMSQYRQQIEDWQKTRPEVPPAIKQWEESRPNIPLPGLGGHGMPHRP